MTDIVDQLRDEANHVSDLVDDREYVGGQHLADLAKEAADEIERLRVLAHDLADVLSHMVVGWEDRIGHDLAKHPEVQRVMAIYRETFSRD